MVGKSKKEILAELHGFFQAFEWVNGKTNHGYSFDISTADAAEINALITRVENGSS